MKNQVTSIEQSKRLIELGVPADKASMVWELAHGAAGEINYELKIWQELQCGDRLRSEFFGPDKIPAHAITSGNKYANIYDVVRYVEGSTPRGVCSTTIRRPVA